MPRPRHPKMAQWYQDYLDSPKWSTLRNKIFLARGHQCQDCLSRRKRGLTLHHVTYARVGGRELPEDLRILCNKCHRTAHRWHDIPYLFTCYREWDEAQVILATATNDQPFPYPKKRIK